MAQDFKTNALFPGGDGKHGVITYDPYPEGLPPNVFKINKPLDWWFNLVWNAQSYSMSCSFTAEVWARYYNDSPFEKISYTNFNFSGECFRFGGFIHPEETSTEIDYSTENITGEPNSRVQPAVIYIDKYSDGGNPESDPDTGLVRYAGLDTTSGGWIGPKIDIYVFGDQEYSPFPITWSDTYTEDESTVSFNLDFDTEYQLDSQVDTAITFTPIFVRLMGDMTVDIYIEVPKIGETSSRIAKLGTSAIGWNSAFFPEGEFQLTIATEHSTAPYTGSQFYVISYPITIYVLGESVAAVAWLTVDTDAVEALNGMHHAEMDGHWTAQNITLSFDVSATSLYTY